MVGLIWKREEERMSEALAEILARALGPAIAL